ncbi:MAG: patatin family protein [Clostridia bacterium]|nr:patatin family protein [Clostridia bacterium]
MKTAIIDTGGGLRAIYACGVLDRCMADGIEFDTCIGISAGSANVASFLAGQYKKNYRFYTEFSARKEYMSLRNFITKRSYIDLDYIYGVLSNSDGEAPLDYQRIMENPAELQVIATNALTGKPTYFDKRDMKQDSYGILGASSCIPLVCSPYYIDGVPYYDGAFSDPIPVQRAFEMGCDRVVVVICKPKSFYRDQKKDHKIYSGIKRKFPNAAETALARAELYDSQLNAALEYERQGRVLIVAPSPDDSAMGTLSRNVDEMDALYECSYRDAAEIGAFISGK